MVDLEEAREEVATEVADWEEVREEEDSEVADWEEAREEDSVAVMEVVGLEKVRKILKSIKLPI